MERPAVWQTRAVLSDRRGRSIRARRIDRRAPEVAQPSARDGVLSPVWDETPLLTAGECRAAFDSTSHLTLGVEEELMLVDPQTLDLAPAVHEAMELLADDPRFAPELRAAQIEIITPVCTSVSEAIAEVADARARLISRLDGRLAVIAAGTHPRCEHWGQITKGPRYRKIADEYAWAATRSLMCGLHIHVAVPGADRALAVYNALRSYLPEIAALGANSPFVEGRDTDMCSIRPKLNEFFPRSGVPPAFPSWERMLDFVAWGRGGGLFPDWTHFWWDLRPSPAHGTIEMRVNDTQTRIEQTGAVVALVQALTSHLAERFDAEGELPVHDSHFINENCWRAHRYGLSGQLVDLDTGRPVAMRDRLSQLLEVLEPYALRLGAAEELGHARGMLERGNGAELQRAVFRQSGLHGLVRWLANETRAGVPVAQP